MRGKQCVAKTPRMWTFSASLKCMKAHDERERKAGNILKGSKCSGKHCISRKLSTLWSSPKTMRVGRKNASHVG